MAKALTAFRAAAVVVLAATACVASRSRTSEIPLRVASYNIQAGGDDLGRIVSAIRDLNADVVGLQEVDVHWLERSRFADQATALGTALRMHVRFAPIYRIPNANPSLPVREFGVAILSRLPVVEFENDSLTRLSTQQANATPALMPGLANAVLDVQGRHVRVLVTHLDYRADPAVRSRQVAEMLRHADGDPLPAILLGDLNAPPDAPELQPLFTRFRDAWTASLGSGFTYPALSPVKRIDYVLVSPDFRVVDATVAPTTAADHRPVVATLLLGR